MSTAVPYDVAETPLLHQLMERLLTSCQPIAVRQNSFFINDIRPGIPIHADIRLVSSLLGNILCLVAKNSRNTCIKITAKSYHDVLLLHIKDAGAVNNYAILSQLQHLQLLTEKIGGFLDITSKRNKETTIAFSFINRNNNCLLPDACSVGSTIRKL